MEIRISVRSLVEFLLREGDIDNRKGGGFEDAMQEGSRLHRKLQKERGLYYQAEVALSLSYLMSSYNIRIEGRADGIEVKPDAVTVEEIKCTYGDLKFIEEPRKVHLAQAKVYAYIYGRQNGLEKIGVRMTYCNLETEEIKEMTSSYSMDELSVWFEALMEEYRKWADYIVEWERLRTESILQTSFPFPYREGQKELVAQVYATMTAGRKLFIEAPTGVGKTIATVYPAVQAMGRGLCEKIFYLTAKTVTGQVASDTLTLLRDKGTRIKSVVLTARDKVCPLEEAECNPVACPRAKGHFDRINDAIYDLLTHEDSFERDKILKYAEKHMVCPFEMSLDMSLFADAVICDYNYVFDPHVRLQRFFADGVGGDYIFLVDEAHNLVDRGRSMYSAELYKEDFLRCKRLFTGVSSRIASSFERCNRVLLSYKKDCDEGYRVLGGITDFLAALKQTYTLVHDFFEDEERRKIRGVPSKSGFNLEELKKEMLEFYFDIAHFLLMSDYTEEGYVIYDELLEDGRFMIRLYCVDPSSLLKDCMHKGRSTILFSATLLPIEYYKKLLSWEAGDYEVYARTVFDPSRKGLLIASDVTSLYKKRTEEQYRNIAEYIMRIVRCRHGNYMVFFPSHAFMNRCLEKMSDLPLPEESQLLVQKEHMTEDEREAFLSAFSEEHPDRFLVGFCVLGGIFGEGIDLKGDALIGAVIVGTGMPQVGVSQTILRDYFDDESGSGFDYAYRFPGMNKVLQAAGRVIRTQDDIGLVVLLDDRFRDFSYRRMFPREWEKYEIVRLDSVEKRAESFWNKWLT